MLLVMEFWAGLAAPTPASTVRTIHGATVKVLEDPAVRNAIEVGLNVPTPGQSSPHAAHRSGWETRSTRFPRIARGCSGAWPSPWTDLRRRCAPNAVRRTESGFRMKLRSSVTGRDSNSPSHCKLPAIAVPNRSVRWRWRYLPPGLAEFPSNWWKVLYFRELWVVNFCYFRTKRGESRPI